MIPVFRPSYGSRSPQPETPPTPTWQEIISLAISDRCPHAIISISGVAFHVFGGA